MAGVTDPRTAPAPTTLGELRDSGATYRTVKAELRANLLARMQDGKRRVEPGLYQDFGRVMADCGGYVQIGIGMMQGVKPPQQRNFVHQAMHPVSEEIQQHETRRQ